MRDTATDSGARQDLADLLDVYVQIYNEKGEEALAKDALDEARSLRRQIDGPADPADE